MSEPRSWTTRQQMLTLSYLAYVGMLTTPNDPAKVSELISEFLASLAPVKDQWRFVWGPAIKPGLFVDQHLAYAVQNIERPEEIVIAIRGTNPLSIENLLVEVGGYAEQVAWDFGHGFVADEGGRIAKGVDQGIACLIEMTPLDGLPGAGTTLLEFAASVAAAHDRDPVLRVTGHSLGGTLASTMALLLVDALAQDSVAARVGTTLPASTQISSVSFAGFTAGDASFAHYSDKRLPSCDRVHGSLDTVPRMYTRKGLLETPGLYTPEIPRSRLMQVGVTLSLAMMAANGTSYRQIEARAPALAGCVNPDISEFVAQMLWQHTQGYVDALELTGIVDLIELLRAGADEAEGAGD